MIFDPVNAKEPVGLRELPKAPNGCNCGICRWYGNSDPCPWIAYEKKRSHLFAKKDNKQSGD